MSGNVVVMSAVINEALTVADDGLSVDSSSSSTSHDNLPPNEEISLPSLISLVADDSFQEYSFHRRIPLPVNIIMTDKTGQCFLLLRVIVKQACSCEPLGVTWRCVSNEAS